jgi:hypothetical protein
MKTGGNGVVRVAEPLLLNREALFIVAVIRHRMEIRDSALDERKCAVAESGSSFCFRLQDWQSADQNYQAKSAADNCRDEVRLGPITPVLSGNEQARDQNRNKAD